jgi:tartrate-resistant acid phosphatase type 5
MRSTTLLGALAILGLVVACGSAAEDDAGDTSSTGGSGASATGGTAGTGGAAVIGVGGAAAGGSSGEAGSGAGGEAGSGAGGAPAGGAGGESGASNAVVKLIAIGDTGEGNENQNLVADQMDKKCAAVGGCTAVVMLGDNFYSQGVKTTDDTQWVTKFEQIYDRPNLNGLKFYATLGNHDYGLTSSGSKEAQINYTKLPVGTGPGTRPSDKWVMYDAYYDQRLPDPTGPVHLFSIDTQDTSDTQRNVMSGKVKQSSATWKIVFAHHPRYTSGEHYWDNQALGLLGMFRLQETIFCAGADMFLTGHDHNLEFIDKGAHSACPNVYFVISGAGAKTREKFQLTPTHKLSRYYNEKIPGLAYLEFSGRTLQFEFIDKNGTLLWSKTITK